jgi:hypothetical protein
MVEAEQGIRNHVRWGNALVHKVGLDGRGDGATRGNRTGGKVVL